MALVRADNSIKHYLDVINLDNLSMFICYFVRYYSATIIKMSGVRSETTAIWLSAVTAAVNFMFTFLGVYLVERIGRRPLTLGSLLGMQLITKHYYNNYDNNP